MPEEPNTEQNNELSEQSARTKDAYNNKIVELEASVAQLKDQLLRKAAEFENYKKRVENDYATTVKFANEDLIIALLPVVDDFYRSLSATKDTSAEPQSVEFARGVELIYNKLLKILEAQGVKQFDAEGKPFDPHYHDALLQVPRADVPAHTVIEEVEKGYMLHDKVIRHAKVIVSSEPPADELIKLEGNGPANGHNEKDTPN